MAADSAHASQQSQDEETRRDFLYLVATAMGVVGTGAFVWPLVDSMNPSADVLALASTEVDLSPIEVGQSLTVKWRGKPVFIRHRTEEEIAAAADVSLAELPHQETDADRVVKPEWLIVGGNEKGEYGGWFCPCHGSHYDTSGRIRKGPAPENLPVPPVEFLDETTIKIG